MGKSKGPDAVGAATAQGVADRETARDVTYADRPDQYNPWGSITWGQEMVTDPATGEQTTKWTQNQNLSADSQDLYDTQLGIMRGKSKLAGGMMGRISDEMGAAPDWAQFGDVQGLNYDPNQIRGMAEDAAYQKETSRLDPRFQGQEEALMIKLRNRGLKEGDQAYDSAMANLGTERTDAYEQARLGATATGRQEAEMMYGQQMGQSQYANALREQQIAEYLGKRGHSLSESERLNEGSGLGDLIGMAGGGS